VTWTAPPELEPEAPLLVELEAAGAELDELDELDELEPQAARVTAAITRGRMASGRLMGGSVPARPRLTHMSGHSKWHSIKHKKAVVDARRGQQFTKLARAITVAAREGGGDADGNPGLALAIQKARDASMPKDNIERAIAKGTGEGADADQIETVIYEGYGPGGVALLIEALTDNRNRTGADVRHLLNKHGGNLGEPGSVSYLFEKRGVITVDATRYDEDDLIPAIDAGAQDIELDDDVFEVITEHGDLARVREALSASGVQFESADLVQRPKAKVSIDDGDAAKLMRLIDALEESDDVSAVNANFDVDAAVLERIAG
jgi:YebC/PmpR family DNA-binding regulatory protein